MHATKVEPNTGQLISIEHKLNCNGKIVHPFYTMKLLSKSMKDALILLIAIVCLKNHCHSSNFITKQLLNTL